MAQTLGPYSVSPELLARADMRAALAARDFATAFHLMRKYDGVSQDRIASPIEAMTQSRISKIMRGKSCITTQVLVERIADGLHIPGELVGLAPRPWEEPDTQAGATPAGHRPAASPIHRLDALPALRTPARPSPTEPVIFQSFDGSARTMGGEGVPFSAPLGEWEGMVTMAARRALRFAVTVGSDSVGPDTVALIHDEVTRLARAYPVSPLATIFGDLADLQEATFRLLEARRLPADEGNLYLMAGAVSGMLAKASHDLGNPQAAMTQARTAYICADKARHDGLKVWVRTLQSLVAYWAGRHREAAQYADLGAEIATRVRGTATAWLFAQQARSFAVLGAADQAEDAIRRADRAREQIEPDELDAFGGLLTFPRPRQLYYAADARIWVTGGHTHAEHTATEAIAAYEQADAADRSFSDEAGARADQALARLSAGNLDGAAESLRPVLDLPAVQRIAGIVTSANRVHEALRRSPAGQDSAAAALQDEIEVFAATPAIAGAR